MVERVSQKHPTVVAADQIRSHDRAVENWMGSKERNFAMKSYPGEYIAAYKGDVIAHFKDQEELFDAVRKSHKELMLIVIDKMSPPEEKDFFKLFRESVNTNNPIEIRLTELEQEKMHSFTRGELDHQWGDVG